MNGLAQQLTDAVVASGKKLVDEYKITGDENGLHISKNGKLWVNSSISLMNTVQWVLKVATPGDRITIDADFTVE